MKIYDSLSNKKFALDLKKISIYNCGPTVYNDIHIGNARPLVTFDVLNRFLLSQNLQVQYIHNITDIDDKIINRAKELKTQELDLSHEYYLHYLDVNKALNILPMTMPKVSQHIPDIIKYIEKLIKTNAAYVTDNGDVYFDIKSVKNYGVLSHQNIDELMQGVRKDVAIDKKSPLDFVLWKKTDTGLKWESPWSTGRPGWHTECALFIDKYVGDHVTIHGGGIDLKFPHHENENAQNNALYKRNIADLWMHVGHINANDEKMAKSVGNFVLVKDLLKEYNGNDIRWFMYQARYENPINYTDKIFLQVHEELNKIFQQINNGYIQMFFHDVKPMKIEGLMDEQFIEFLNDDLDFPNAKSVIFKQTKKLSGLVKGKKFDKFQLEVGIILAELNVLGIIYTSPLENPEILSLLNEWKKALQEKNYIVSDKYRQQLIDKKII